MKGEFCILINVNVVSQCKLMDVITQLLDVLRRLRFIIKWQMNKEGSRLLLTFNMVNILVSNMRGVQFC